MILRRIIFILVIFLPGVHVFSQESVTGQSHFITGQSHVITGQSHFITGLRSHYGFIIPHSRQIRELSGANPWGFELDFNWHLKKRGVWEYCYCYPRTGMSILYTNLDNPEVMGHAVSFYPFIEPFIRAEHKLSYSIRFGIGPSYLTKIYHPEDNPDNFFFGSHLSFVALLNFGVNYRFNEHLSGRLAFNYNHISNGGLKLPNVGINFPTFNAGIDYSFDEVRFESREKDPAVDLNPVKNRYDLIVTGTAKTVEKGEEERHPVYGVGLMYSRVTGRLLALSGGVEWVNDLSHKEKVRRNDLRDEQGNYLDHNRLSAMFGVEWLFGRFIFSQHLGVYFYEPYQARNRAYQRYGLVFRLSDHIYSGVSIRTHGHVADLLDVRLGFYL